MALFKRNAVVKQDIDEEDVNILKEIIGLILYIAAVVLLIFLILTYVGGRTQVSGNSMNDTLADGDSLWVSKLSYRFGEPERFDIVVFPYDDPVTGNEVFYVKRIIGLPSETIGIDHMGNIVINGEILEESYGKEVIDEYHIGRASEPITLGEDEYFVMGDNRNNSKDSRDETVGNIKREMIEGKAVFRMWPLKDIEVIGK